jgi:uncharacterized protein YunC (DUF1805 family)
MKPEQFELANGTAEGYMVDLPKAPLVLIRAGTGFIMCGFLNIAAANKLGVIAGRATGVRTYDELMRAPLVEVSNEAKAMGITEGMLGRDALEMMFGVGTD